MEALSKWHITQYYCVRDFADSCWNMFKYVLRGYIWHYCKKNEAAISRIENKNVEVLKAWMENIFQWSWKYLGNRRKVQNMKLLLNSLKTILQTYIEWEPIFFCAGLFITKMKATAWLLSRSSLLYKNYTNEIFYFINSTPYF